MDLEFVGLLRDLAELARRHGDRYPLVMKASLAAAASISEGSDVCLRFAAVIDDFSTQRLREMGEEL